MERRLTCLILAGSLALGLGACSVPSGAESPQAVPSPVETEPPAAAWSPTPSPDPFLLQRADVPPGDYAPWQTAYADFLTRALRQDGIKVETESGDTGDMYCLYDADEDGTPELFVQYGTCEADYHTVCYAFRDGRVEALDNGDFGSGHGMIYTCPGESAFLFCWGHMGYAEISKVPVEDGGLGEWERLLEENTNPSAGQEARPYTHPGELVPGAEAVPYYYTRSCRDRAQTPPLVLPIYDYEAYPRQAAPCAEEAEVRAAIGKVLWENGEFYGCSGDNFYGATGRTVLNEYLMEAYPYNDEPLVLKEYAFADGNGDGQTDGILRLEEVPDQYGNASRFYAVLSLQGDEVYAYFFGFTDGFGIDPDGTVYLRDFGQWDRVSFYKNQCYGFPALSDPVEGQDLAWDAFPPEKP